MFEAVLVGLMFSILESKVMFSSIIVQLKSKLGGRKGVGCEEMKL